MSVLICHYDLYHLSTDICEIHYEHHFQTHNLMLRQPTMAIIFGYITFITL